MTFRVDGPDPTLCGEWGEESLMHAILLALLRERRLVEYADTGEGLELRIGVTPDYAYINVQAKIGRKHKLPRAHP